MQKITLIYLLIFAWNLIYAQEQNLKLNGVDEEIEALIQAYQAVGISVAVVKDDEVIYAKGFGYRDLEKKLPVDENTVFHIASVTKSFTASLLGILEKEGKVSLQQKPAYYIPKLQFHNSEMDNLITIESLLSHKSGIGNWDGSLVLFAENNRLKSLKKFKYLKPNGKINDSWIYSNAGYTIAGTVVEQVTGESWDKNIRDRIFEPLDMDNSFLSIENMKRTNNYSLPYGLKDGTTKEVLFEEYFDYSPAGAIKSCAKDLANWTITWLNEGKFEGKQILPKDYVYDATSIQNIRDGEGSEEVFLFGDGFGWRMESQLGQYKVYHGGNTSGFSSLVLTYPFTKLGIIVLSNQQNSLLPYIIGDLIKNRMLDLSKTAISDYPVIVTDIYTDDKVVKPINEENKPSHSLADFCGKYFHKGYGTLEIIQKENSLFVVYPSYTFRLQHTAYNSFQMKLTKEISQVLNPEFFYLDFQTNYKGKVGSLKTNLQYEPVEFIKQMNE